jgi:endonuclease YncB( thermonuclease family)
MMTYARVFHALSVGTLGCERCMLALPYPFPGLARADPNHEPRMMISRLLLLAAIFMTSNVDAATAFAGTVSYVSDGDTLWVQPDTGDLPRKLRIQGIDAPEICQTGGESSRAVLTRHALNKRVEVTVRGHDVYGRGLARIRLDGHDLGAQMVRAGQAWSYRWRRSPGPYAAEEAVARQSRRGLFAVGQPELPHDFRKRHGTCHAARQ